MGSLRENLRFTVDLSSRVTVASTGDLSYQNVVGLDLHKVVAGDRGDWGTLVLQGYLTRIDNQTKHPPFFDGPDDIKLVYRILNFNFTHFGRGRLNVRFGHFEIPFGLEHMINTNGTLRDYMHGPNLGLKADWGVGVNGSFPRMEYEVTLSRGTGNDVSSVGNPYILAGRIGTPRDENVVLGASVFQGRVWNPGAARQWSAGFQANPLYRADFDQPVGETLSVGVIERQRYGVDAQWYSGLLGVLAEVAYGQDSGLGGLGTLNVLNSLLEVNRTNNDGWLNTYAQTRFFNREAGAEWSRAAVGALGARFTPDGHWAVSGEYVFDVVSPRGERGHSMRSQVRYRF